MISAPVDDAVVREGYRALIPGVHFLNLEPGYKTNWDGWANLLSIKPEANWYVRCNSGAHVNHSKIERELLALPLDTAVYAGKPSSYDEYPFDYAISDCCEAMNRRALKNFADHADACSIDTAMDERLSNPRHDVEIGRCMHKMRVPLTPTRWECKPRLARQPSTPSFALSLPQKRRKYRLIVSVKQTDPVVEACWSAIHRSAEFHRSTPTDTYPPYQKNMRLWQELKQDNLTDFFVRCDADTLVNTTNLYTYIDSLDPHDLIYAGKVGTGREHERELLGLNSETFSSFVMGGMCEIVSRAALQTVNLYECKRLTEAQLGPYFPQSPTHHSDVELGRCMAHSGIVAEAPKPFVSVALDSFAVTSSTPIRGRGLCHASKAQTEKVLAAHSVKDPMAWMLASSDSKMFHTPRNCGCSHTPTQTFLDTGCTNPLRFDLTDKCGVWLPPCPLPMSSDYNGKIGAVHIVGRAAESRLSDIPDIFDVYEQDFIPHKAEDKFQIEPSSTLTSGEIAYIRALRRVLSAALHLGDDRFIVLEDDFMVHKAAPMRYSALIKDGCMDEVLDNNGIFLLGFTVWNQRAWNGTAPEMSKSLCINAHRSMFGSFANIYTRKAAQAVIEWIDATAYVFPFDHVYVALTEAGYPVRGAYDPVIVADVSHVSTVNAGDPVKHNAELRHEKHRWGSRNDYIPI